ncbi:MAG: hypothetical protein WD847_21065 [Pirellulales bacterium]
MVTLPYKPADEVADFDCSDSAPAGGEQHELWREKAEQVNQSDGHQR